MQQSVKEKIIDKEICMRLYSYVVTGYVTSEERNKSFEALIKDISLNSEGIKHILSDTGPTPHVIAKDILLRRCGQTEILPFEECYPSL